MFPCFISADFDPKRNNQFLSSLVHLFAELMFGRLPEVVDVLCLPSRLVCLRGAQFDGDWPIARGF